MDSATVSFLHLLRERVQALVDEGNLDEAVHAASAAVEKAQQTLNNDFETVDEFVDALEVRADLLRLTSRFEEARDDYRQALDQLDERPDRAAQAGRLLAGLGSVYDSLEQPDRAESCWEQAIVQFEKLDPPALLDVAAMCNNLAFLRKAAGDFDGAESHFLRALQIDHEILGQDHEETALLSNNLGALYQAANCFEQAREMHLMALAARQKLLGEHHPDTGQSHNNLALALAMTGDRDRAIAHFEQALDIFTDAERLWGGYAAELEAVAGNFSDYLSQLGEEEAAAAVAARATVVPV